MSTADALRRDVKVIGLVGAAHGLSHFFQIATAVLFPLIKDDLGVSYAALGATVGLYYTVSAICQTLAGFAVDRFGARRVSQSAVLAFMATSILQIVAALSGAETLARSLLLVVRDGARVEALQVARRFRGLRPADITDEGWEGDGGEDADDGDDDHQLDEREAFFLS